MLRIQTSYKQTKERQQVHNRNTTQDRTDGKTTNNKQQTQTCNYLQTKNESKTRTTNNQTPRTSNLVIWKVQTVLQKEECYERRGCCLQSENTNIKLNKKGNNDKQHLFNRNTTQDNIRQENDNKQTKLFITYKQKETRPNIQNTRTLNCAK